MQEFDQELLKTIEGVANIFAVETVQKLIRGIKRRKLTNTKQLINSLDAETRSDLGRIAHSIAFAFEEYGRYHDMKSNRWTTMPPIEKILDWVEKKGLSAFGPDPHPYRIKQKPDERRKNEIAWGIARNKLEPRSHKKRPWFQSTFYKSLNALQEELILGIGDRTLEQMKSALLDRLKRGATTKAF